MIKLLMILTLFFPSGLITRCWCCHQRLLRLLSIFLLFFSFSLVYSQTISVMNYELKTTPECIEDWVETDPAEYIGVYAFVHNGTFSYALSYKDKTPAVEYHYLSNVVDETSPIGNVVIDKNKITGMGFGWNKFSGRFVKLKCDVNSDVLKGFKGLLMDEEILYIIQGD